MGRKDFDVGLFVENDPRTQEESIKFVREFFGADAWEPNPPIFEKGDLYTNLNGKKEIIEGERKKDNWMEHGTFSRWPDLQVVKSKADISWASYWFMFNYHWDTLAFMFYKDIVESKCRPVNNKYKRGEWFYTVSPNKILFFTNYKFDKWTLIDRYGNPIQWTVS